MPIPTCHNNIAHNVFELLSNNYEVITELRLNTIFRSHIKLISETHYPLESRVLVADHMYYLLEISNFLVEQ